jgi:hypothetical protein
MPDYAERVQNGGMAAGNIHGDITYSIMISETKNRHDSGLYLLSLGEILTPRARVDQRLMYLWLIGSSDPSIIKLAYHQAERSIKWMSDHRGPDRTIVTPPHQSKMYVFDIGRSWLLLPSPNAVTMKSLSSTTSLSRSISQSVLAVRPDQVLLLRYGEAKARCCTVSACCSHGDVCMLTREPASSSTLSWIRLSQNFIAVPGQLLIGRRAIRAISW